MKTIILCMLTVSFIAKFASTNIRKLIKEKFHQSNNAFWKDEEIEHLNDDSMDIFSCFVEKPGECEYFLPKSFSTTCKGCEVIDTEFIFKNPSTDVLVTDDTITFIDASSLLSPVTATKSLHIVNSLNLVRIDSNIFEMLPNLEEVIIFNTGISSIPNIVATMTKVKKMAVVMNINLIRVSDYAFSNLQNLEQLNLACNKIAYISDRAFDGLNSLKKITVGNNALTIIPPAMNLLAKTVNYIGLERNSITLLPFLPLREMDELLHLNLTSNSISKIETEWVNGCPNLKFIEMGYNNMPVLEPKSISSLGKLVYACVSDNADLVSINGNAFKDLPSLKILDLFGNPKLSNIDYRAFNNVPNIKYIDMSRNFIKKFPHDVFVFANFKNLERLFLRRNGMTTLTDLNLKSFNEITNILKIPLRGIYPLSASFKCMEKLVFLDLKYNNLKIIPGIVLDCLKIENSVLDLSFNLIATVEEDAFNGMDLSELYLNNNRLKEVPKALFKLKGLAKVWLNKNLLTFLEEGTISNLDNTQEIYLQDNQILAIEDDALPRNLEYIDISKNVFGFIDENQFNNMPNLIRIKFDNNRIRNLPLNVFQNNNQLSYISLNQNNIAWVNSGVFTTCSETLSLINMEENTLAYVEHGTFADKNIIEVLMKNNDLHDWPADRSFSDQDEPFYADFSENKFEVIRENMFSNHKNFQKADFKGNHISDIETKAFKDLEIDYKNSYSKIHGVILTDNPISKLEPYSFYNIVSSNVGGGIKNHAGLDLQNIPTLYTLRSNTFYQVTLDYIFLNNGMVTMVETMAFNEISLHFTLQMNDGPLKYIAKNAVNAKNIKFIQFNDNQVGKLPLGAFAGIEKCQNFNIDNNNITFIDTDSLPDCTDKFNFQNNLITHIVADAFRQAKSIQRLQLDGNKIIKIEAGAFDTVIGKLKSLTLSNNPLPELPDYLLDTATINDLGLTGNKMIRTVGVQSLESNSGQNIPTLRDAQQAYVHAKIYENLEQNVKNVYLYNADSCTCNVLQSIKYITANGGTIDVKGPTKCEFVNIKNGNIENHEITTGSPSTLSGKLPCEPFTTKTVRKSTSFQDQIPTSETVTVYWQFPQPTGVWGDVSKKYCCFGAQAGCIKQATVVMHCERQAVGAATKTRIITTSPFSVSLLSSDSCDKEFSHSENIVFSTADFIFCTVQLEIPDKKELYSSLGPWRIGYQEELIAFENIPCSAQSKSFDVTYFDLTNDFVDFQNMGYDVIYKDPKLYDSPNIGSYLYMKEPLSDTDTLTQWFTPNTNVVNIAQETLCLSESAECGIGSSCMFAREWWPVDHLVETPSDTSGNFLRHNMYFSARFRMPIVYKGEETITIAGPDDIWVFMDGLLVLEVLAVEDDSADLPCGKISFSEGTLVTKMGMLNLNKLSDYTNRCTDLTTVTNKVEASKFELSSEIQLDIFTTQRRSLKSRIYIYLKNVQNTNWSNFIEFSMSESKLRDGEIGVLDLNSVLGAKTYQFTITDSNDNFEVQKVGFDSKIDPQVPTANTNPGNGIPDYYNCEDVATVVPSITPTPKIDVDTPKAFIILKNAIDYESIDPKFKYLFLNIVYEYDATNMHSVYNNIRIKINVVDVNDNCPKFDDAALTLIDRTQKCLHLSGKTLVVNDADDGDNRLIQYFVVHNMDKFSTSRQNNLFIITPPPGSHKVLNLNDEDYTIYKTVKDYFTNEKFMVEYEIDVYAVDKGSPVRLGTLNKYQLKISASCIQNIEFIIGLNSGDFNVKVPGWMVSTSTLVYCDTCSLGYRCAGFGDRTQCSTCTRSFANLALDSATFSTQTREEDECSNPSEWEISFGAQWACGPCKPGWECKDGVGTPVEQLEREAGEAVGTHQINLCVDSQPSCVQLKSICEAGYNCRAGVAEKCRTGTYSTPGSSLCAFCDPGKYTDTTGSSTCLCCEGGMESTHSKESCDYCAENEISAECEICRPCNSETECPCLKNPRLCSKGVQCVNLPGDSHKCLSCPAGFADQDGGCVDVDECSEYKPCSLKPLVSCLNTVPGFRCGSCPLGFTGNAPQGVGEPQERQICTDINECDTANGDCDVNSECHNAPGYHYCGNCFGDYVGNGTVPCKSGDYCATNLDNCHADALCIMTGPAGFTCECSIMLAGNGLDCGTDKDGDGLPDQSLNCQGSSCVRDNCIDIPNSNQADADSDSRGDACDTDIDEDKAINEQDLCPYKKEVTNEMGNNEDSDSDGWVDACDNCPGKKNVDQYDKNNDGVGDECETCRNEACFTDTLPSCSGRTGVDSDGDGIDDTCDNCPFVANPGQRDTDGDKTGDKCDDDVDGDSHLNSADNCPYRPNTDQANKDMDWKGDLCDDSLSWPETITNDADADGDSVPDVDDICPFDKGMSSFSFTTSQLVDISRMSEPADIRWKVTSKDVALEAVMYERTSQGKIVIKDAALEDPIALIGENRFKGLRYDGTFYVADKASYPTLGNGAIGIIFGYQKLQHASDNTRFVVRFYLASWRHNYYAYTTCTSGQYNNCNFGATTGLQIKQVTIDSISSANSRRDILWWSAYQKSAEKGITTKMIFQDPKRAIWKFNTAYRWRLIHQPSTGRITMSIHTVATVNGVSSVNTVVDTGDLFDKTISGGQIGLYSFAQWNTTFANIAVKCLEAENYAAIFDGIDDRVSLGDLDGMKITRSFEISAWFKISIAPAVSDPVICKNQLTSVQTLCLSVNAGVRNALVSLCEPSVELESALKLNTKRFLYLKVIGEYAGFAITSEESVQLNVWKFALLRYDMQYKNLRLYHNLVAGSKKFVQSTLFVDVTPISNEELYLGWDGSNSFKGEMEEVRLLNRLIHEDDYLYTLMFKPSLIWENNMRLVALHINFDRNAIIDVLGNIQISTLNTDSALLPKLIRSTIMGQIYRYDDVNRGELEKNMQGISQRKRRAITSRNRRDYLRINSHNEL